MTDTSTPIKRLNPGVMSEQVAVRVRNVGPKTLKLDYANQRWEIAPGEDAIAPYLGSCYWFGDPRAVNIGNPSNRSLQYRDRELERLSVLYGVYGEAFMVDEDDVFTEEERVDQYRTLPARPYVNRRHPNLPQVEVFDLTTSERILTVIDDPAGDNNAEHTNTGESTALVDQMKQMQRQINTMASQLAQTDPEAARQVLASAPAPSLGGGAASDDIAARLEGDGDELGDPVADPDSRATVDGTDAIPKTKPAK